MSAARTLLRKLTKERVVLDGQVIFADLPARPQRLKRGTFERRVTTLTASDAVHEHTFHATKGHRYRRLHA